MFQIKILSDKEKARKAAEAELANLRKELLVLGEERERLRDQMAKAPHLVASKHSQMVLQAFEKQIEGDF